MQDASVARKAEDIRVTVHDLLFAGNCALNTTTKEDMQWSIDLFAAECANFGLTINTDKTVVMQRQSPNAEQSVPRFHVNGTEQKTVDNVIYLGSVMSSCIRIGDKMAHRISTGSQVFGRLQNSVWNRYGFQLDTKLKMRKVVVLTTLLYGAQTWIIYASKAKQISHFHLNCLRRLLKLRWQDRISDTEVLKQTGALSIQGNCYYSE
nr:unnamed protein product [Spirometra erinaceieuropaei]